MIKFKIWFILLSILVAFLSIYILTNYKKSPNPKLIEIGSETKTPLCIQTYYLIEKYSEKYHIPKYIAYNVAYLETRYRGPFDWNYNPHLTSSSGAVGPMQIMVQTASFIHQYKINGDSLKFDLELNISTSMKILNFLYKKYDDWGIACGYYNTGYPKVNQYATFCVTNKSYVKNWISN